MFAVLVIVVALKLIYRQNLARGHKVGSDKLQAHAARCRMTDRTIRLILMGVRLYSVPFWPLFVSFTNIFWP